jgi:hypothetical protein
MSNIGVYLYTTRRNGHASRRSPEFLQIPMLPSHQTNYEFSRREASLKLWLDATSACGRGDFINVEERQSQIAVRGARK